MAQKATPSEGSAEALPLGKMGDQKSRVAIVAVLLLTGKTEKRAGNAPNRKLSRCQSADLSVSCILECFGVRHSLPKATF